MQINMKDGIKGYDGQPLMDGAEPAQLRTIFINAINTIPDGQQLGAEEKARIYALSVKMYGSSKITLTMDERTFLRAKVGAVYNPLIYGRVCELLDPIKPAE